MDDDSTQILDLKSFIPSGKLEIHNNHVIVKSTFSGLIVESKIFKGSSNVLNKEIIRIINIQHNYITTRYLEEFDAK